MHQAVRSRPSGAAHRSGDQQRQPLRSEEIGGEPSPIAPEPPAINDSYQYIQQDILESFVDRGQLRNLAAPTVLPTGKRIPGLKPDHPRQLALTHALVRFAHVAAGSSFTTAEIQPYVAEALRCSASKCSLASLRYDLSKLHGKNLVEKPPHSRRYRLPSSGYSLCLIFLKLFERIFAPLTAGLLSPISGDRLSTAVPIMTLSWSMDSTL